MTMNIKVNEEFYVERYDFFACDLKGKTIVDVIELDIGLAVKFKELIEGAEDWDNEVHFYEGCSPGVWVDCMAVYAC